VVDKVRLAAIFTDIATLLELKGENPFKIRAYQTASGVIERIGDELDTLIASGERENVKGIGKAISAKIHEFADTGAIAFYEDVKASVPPVLFDLIAIPGLGPKKALILQEKLGINSIGELEYACRENRLIELPGFGEKTQQKILQGIEYVKKFQGQFLLVDTWPVADKIVEYLNAHESIEAAAVAGSIRRRNETTKDIDIVVTSSDPAAAAEAVINMPGVTQVTGSGMTKTSVTLSTGMNLDVRVVAGNQFACALHHFTGSKEHHIGLRGIAREQGYKINEYGIENGAGGTVLVGSERELYALLSLAYIEPELREGMGELEASAAGKLPVLVSEQDIRGVFHVHTNYSDGSAGLKEMADAAKARGWRYLGIADHSQSAVYARGLRAETVRQQRIEIEKFNAMYPDFTILAGIESDILPDGSLDYPDEILAQFDFVIASVHSAFRQSQADMTRRIIRAAENRHVTMLGHLTGRILLAREGYAVDVPAVIRAAAETGTSIEINASPYRLDLDWRWHRQAKELGVLLSVNPDAHAPDELDYVKFGIATARKGWLEAKDVVNTRDYDEVLKIIHRKKL
jgi:DNA polymerase (family 10)